VAIKVLPPDVATDPDRLRRFEQEARAASALNHPHILTVLDVGSQDGAPYLVTELLEGRSLREVLRHDRLPVAQVLDQALQVARGLAAAHAKGIVHRDLKPENLFVTRDGRVKLLDFGLARLAPGPEGAEALSQAPTEAKLTLTREGAILGTVAYMAPEQVRGEATDTRSDVFAFGAVLYEMLSGRRAFARETAAETMTAILREQPAPVTELRPEVPAAIARLLDRCMAKLPEERFGSAREILFALEVAGTTTSGASVAAAAGATRDPPRARRVRLAALLLAGFAGAALAAAAVLALLPRGERPAAREPVVSSLILPREVGSLVRWSGTPDFALSPDGSRLAYAGVGQDRRPAIWIRDLDSPSVRELSGTANGLGPFWSPDGRFLGFFAEDKLKKVPADGGPVQVLCDALEAEGGLHSATWNRDGVILFSRGGSLVRVSAAGGEPQVVIERDATEETFLRYPMFLPDGRRFIYSARRAQGPSRAYVGWLDASEAPRFLHEGQSKAVVSPTGHLLFVRDGALLAQPLDDLMLRPLGDPKPIATRVANVPSVGRAGFSISDGGRLAYAETGFATEFVWRDREGRLVERLTEEGRYIGPALSPDGRRVAVEIEDAETGQHAIWLLGPGRGQRSRLTRPPHDGHHPTWSPDGREIGFSSTRTGKWLVYRQRADGLGEDLPLDDRSDAFQLFARQWAPGSRGILAGSREPDGRLLLWFLSFRPGEPAVRLAEGQWGALSPDERWLAVATRQAGHHQVYVLPFPGLDTRWQVSAEGGSWPRWRADGRELFYVSEDRKLMSVTVTAGAAFEADPPRPLFELPLRTVELHGDYPHEYDVDASGERFLICQVPDHAAPRAITLVTDWVGLVGQR
jgi:Tol biopolymer transport system component